jgi:hypothetical protein
MKKIKVKIGFSRYSESRFFLAASNIKTRMTANASFPNPSPAPETMTESFDTYSSLLQKGRSRTLVETAAKNQLREQITIVLQGWGTQVQANGNNDRTILLTSGFELSGDPRRYGPLPAPEGLKAEKGLISGWLDSSVEKVEGSRGYSFEIKEAAADRAADWQSTFCTKTKFTFTGLTQGKQYLVRVCAKGTNPSCAYTEPISVWAA